MKRICHFSTTTKYLTWFNNDWDKVQQFLDRHKLDGIELGLTLDYDIDTIPKSMVKGVHLSFFPMWLEFWSGDKQAVSNFIGDEQAVRNYYGDINRDVIVQTYRQQYERAKLLEAEYVVFHVCHIRPEDSFSWQFSYSNLDVIRAAIEIINEAFDHSGPKILFENLWWPGLTFLDKSEAQLLLDSVAHPNRGFVMDISHAILTNPKIANEQMAFNHIRQLVASLGDLVHHIDAIHLNKTLPFHYMRQNQSFKLDRFNCESDSVKQKKLLMDHVNKLDPHEPFNHPLAKDIVDLINPKFCVYETNPQTINELNYFMKQQNIALGISSNQ